MWEVRSINVCCISVVGCDMVGEIVNEGFFFIFFVGVVLGKVLGCIVESGKDCCLVVGMELVIFVRCVLLIVFFSEVLLSFFCDFVVM